MVTADYICSECGRVQSHPACGGSVYMPCRQCGRIEFFFFDRTAAKKYWEDRIIKLKLMIAVVEKDDGTV